MVQKAVTLFYYKFVGRHTDTEYTMLEHIPNMILDKINDLINTHPTLEKVKTMVFELNSKITCGMDSFTGHFFLKTLGYYWSRFVENVESLF